MKRTLTTLVLTVAVLLGLGIVLLATASTVRAQTLYASPHAFFKRQLMWLAIATCVGFFASRFDYHLWRKYSVLTILFYLGIVFLLALVICPGIKVNVNGSYRWLVMGPLRVQPSEFAKLAIVVAFSVWMERIGWRVRQFLKGAVFPCAALGLFVLLLALEPDFGATMVVVVLGGLILIVAGTRFWHLIAMGCIGIPPVILLIMTNENRMNRILAWLEGSDSESSAAYQLQQAILAFKNGGPCGVGFNQSIQKFNYLPEAHTDFIFAIGGEEFGFIFSIGVLIAYAVLLVCSILISIRAQDRLGSLLAFGMTVLLVFQAGFNIGVVTGCLPTKGLALPFISYGGTNLITALFAVGTLINIGKQIDDQFNSQIARNAVDTL